MHGALNHIKKYIIKSGDQLTSSATPVLWCITPVYISPISTFGNTYLVCLVQKVANSVSLLRSGMKRHETYLLKQRICQLMLDNSKHTKAIKPKIW